MAHGNPTSTEHLDARAGDVPGACPPSDPRVLIVSGSRQERLRLAARVSGVSSNPAKADSLAAARMMMDVEHFDVVVIRDQLSDGSGVSLAEELGPDRLDIAFILIADDPTLDDAVLAMRAGIADIIGIDSPAAELVSGVRRAASRARTARQAEHKARRLRRVCRKLNDARQEVTSQVRSLCNDLSLAYDEMAAQMARFSLASEFTAIIRPELDVESLLRTALEFVLAKIGPTNAAVFLPTSSRDFSLGAYVNYDCAKDTADVLLDHLANVVAPRMECESRLISLSPGSDLDDEFGYEAQWLCDSNVVMFACHHEGECLAVVILFRDRADAFTGEHVQMLETISEQFALQLGRVIHIHHRHLPRDQWGAFDGSDEDDADDYGLAA